MESFVTLVGHLAWPTVVLAILYLARNELRTILKNIGQKIGEEGSEVSITREGITVKSRIERTSDLPEQEAERLAADFSDRPATLTTKIREENGRWTVTRQLLDIFEVTRPAVSARTGPGIDYEILTRLPQGTRLGLLATVGDWCQFQVLDSGGKPTGVVGWVPNTFVSKAER